MKEKLIHLIIPFSILFVSLSLIFCKRYYLEYLLYPYPRLVTLISMVLTIAIAFMGFYIQYLNNKDLSKKLYRNIRGQLSSKFTNEKRIIGADKHMLSGFLLNIQEFNKEETKYKVYIRNKSYDELDNDFFTSVYHLLNQIEKDELVNYLADLSDFVNQLLWSPNAIGLKKSERTDLLDFNTKVIELQYLILFLQADTTKPENGKLEKNQFLDICKSNNLITDSKKAEKLLKEIIKFYSNNTESLD